MSQVADNIVASLITRARAAQQVINGYDQAAVDRLVAALGWSIMQPDNNRELASMAVADTGLGNIEHKIIKNHRKTLGLLRDLKDAKTVGLISHDEATGISEVARPVGVVAAIVPSTNPAATPANKAINAIKGRNAVILAPSPKGEAVCSRLLEMMYVEMDKLGAPRDLVQKLPAPISKESTQALLEAADLVVATGSQNNIKRAYASGTPAFGVGAGNVVSIVDEPVDINAAAQRIVQSKTFDNATSCSSENHLVMLEHQAEALLPALHSEGAIMLSADDREKLQQALWQDGRLNPALLAKSASHIAKQVGLTTAGVANAQVLLVNETQAGRGNPFCGEKLSPILSVYQASDFADALNITQAILDYQGKGHSVSIHSANQAHIDKIAATLPVSRVIVNQAHCFATGGSFDNGLPFSLSMGCGTWGGNIFSENLNYRHYLNITRIVRTIAVNEPTLDDVFGDYWQATGQALS